MSKTTVVNLKSCPQGAIYIGRPSPFGNPYVIGQDGDRDEVLRLFRAYFYGRLDLDAVWKEKVEALKGRTLSCFCKPQACHGDIIAEYLDTPR